MAKSIGERLKELQKIARLHVNWFVVSLLGKDAVSAEDLRELEEYGKLPLDDSLDYARKAYILGRLKAILKSSEYKKLNYEEVAEQVNRINLTPLEEYALEHVRLHAADSIKSLAETIMDGAFSDLRGNSQEVLNEAAIRNIRDKTQIAIMERQGAKELASTLATDLKTNFALDWKRIAETELHRAKMMGTAQAIINKVDIYQSSEGPASLISIVPSKDRCEDCHHHFIDEKGNPKVFRLADLLERGTNADSDHSRKNGIHHNWKTTMPPLHPRCACQIVYVPKGMGWENGKLRVVDEDVYVEELKKAVDQGSMSATIKPPGPKSTQGPSASVASAGSPPSMPGAPAPGNTPGPGAPKQQQEGGGQKDEYVDCPFGGGEECEKHGGNGAKTHKRDGEIMKAHRDALQAGAKPEDPAAAMQDHAEQQEKAKNWSRAGPSVDTQLQHLSSGEIAHIHTISEGGAQASGERDDEGAVAGAHEAHRITIEGNGRGLMKPGVTPPNAQIGDGVGTIVPNTEHKREAAAFSFSQALAPGLVPTTTTRAHEGKQHSVQAWQEDAVPVSQTMKENPNYNHYSSSVEALSKMAENLGGKKAKEKVEKKFSEVAVMDLVMNNGDRHLDNLMMPKDMEDRLRKIGEGEDVDIPISAIDNGAAFGTGMMGQKNGVANGFHKAGKKLTIPEEMQERLKGMSLDDMKKSLGDHLEDWEVGQTYLRAQYALHLQETEGHLDFEKFGRTVWSSIDGHEIPRAGAFNDAVSGNEASDIKNRVLDNAGYTWMNEVPHDERENLKFQIKQQINIHEYEKRKGEGTLPNQMFESFAKDWIGLHSRSEQSPYNSVAKELDELGVFMGPGFAENPTQYRKDGKHKEREKEIRTLTSDILAPVGGKKQEKLSPDQVLSKLSEAQKEGSAKPAPAGSAATSLIEEEDEGTAGARPAKMKPKIEGAPAHSKKEQEHRAQDERVFSKEAFADTVLEHAENDDKTKKSFGPRLYLDLLKGGFHG